MAAPSRKKPRFRRWGVISLSVLVAAVVGLLVLVRIRYGGGEPFPDRTSDPELSAEVAELVASLPMPPGNISISATGRVFITFHPDGQPDVKVAEIVDGEAQPYPSSAFQSARDDDPHFQTPLSLRVDAQQRLWVLDLAEHGSGEPQLLGFDLETDELVHHHVFDSEIAPLGSHLNDFAVHPDGTRLYIADASILRQAPALVVYDIEARIARRLLEGHRSVTPEPYVISVEGDPQVVFGIFSIRPGVDSIALDSDASHLYFSAVTTDHMYRVETRFLDDEALSAAALASKVEELPTEITMSDGIAVGPNDTVFITDPEHSAITALTSEGELRTVLKDTRFRWPDGFSFHPDGSLYFTCSALQHVIMQSADTIAEHAPYHVYRFNPPQ